MHVLSAHLKSTKENFSLDIKVDFKKGITGIFGPSGAGKTTLLHLLVGLEQPDDGYIELNERRIVDTSKKIFEATRNRNIGYVFQEGRLFPHMSVRKNLLFGTSYIRKGEQIIAFDELVNLLELRDLLDKKPMQLSGGEKQRVAIGRALLSSPKLLLMDEPFSSLDVKLRRQIIPYLIKINQKFNIPMLVVSHDLPDLLSLTRELFLLKNGRVLGHGNYIDLISQENTLDVMQGAGLMNVIQFKIDAQDKMKGLSFLSNKHTSEEICIERKISNDSCQIGDEVNVSLRPEDIALSLERISNISIRNQLPGTILKVIEKDKRNYCLVDVGFKLLVAITHVSLLKMELSKGKKVWCLFKSMALELNV